MQDILNIICQYLTSLNRMVYKKQKAQEVQEDEEEMEQVNVIENYFKPKNQHEREQEPQTQRVRAVLWLSQPSPLARNGYPL